MPFILFGLGHLGPVDDPGAPLAGRHIVGAFLDPTAQVPPLIERAPELALEVVAHRRHGEEQRVDAPVFSEADDVAGRSSRRVVGPRLPPGRKATALECREYLVGDGLTDLVLCRHGRSPLRECVGWERLHWLVSAKSKPRRLCKPLVYIARFPSHPNEISNG